MLAGYELQCNGAQIIAEDAVVPGCVDRQEDVEGIAGGGGVRQRVDRAVIGNSAGFRKLTGCNPKEKQTNQTKELSEHLGPSLTGEIFHARPDSRRDAERHGMTGTLHAGDHLADPARGEDLVQ